MNDRQNALSVCLYVAEEKVVLYMCPRDKVHGQLSCQPFEDVHFY